MRTALWPALQTLESAALRRSVGLRHDQTGVMVTRIAPLGEAAGVLQAGDVIRAIDGKHLSNDGSVIFRYLMRQCTQRNARADGGRRSRRRTAEQAAVGLSASEMRQSLCVFRRRGAPVV